MIWASNYFIILPVYYSKVPAKKKKKKVNYDVQNNRAGNKITVILILKSSEVIFITVDNDTQKMAYEIKERESAEWYDAHESSAGLMDYWIEYSRKHAVYF